ncbi:flagellar biosynthesis protein FlhF [Paenibacillus bovis]|uniref:Flagellar biosynthesis protein FlhF n=1 Tax=Paenibacillus bovis TaxID=1616788 RepID=A0A172ZGW9_9BACL|nr:flagellar biosynthesis protein FlhF [Paenibacillus bovis]ANF96537.1 flagellar biosynthesis protein FlhF [Paenibacillus bovis]
MRVKRYIVDTMPDAMLKIRTDLGSDAVILSTKELKTGGFLGMFQKKKIEVIAAVEKEQVQEAPKAKPEPVAAAAATPVPKKAVPDAYRKSSQAFAESMRQALAADQPEPVSAAPAAVSPLPEEQPFVPEVASTRLQHIQAAAATVASPAADLTEQMSEQRLFEELRQMKQMMADLTRDKERAELPEPLHQLMNQLKSQGIEQTLLDLWMDRIVEQSADLESMTAMEAKSAAKAQIEQFTESRIGGGIAAETRIVYIAGPTGVGKTTTIAKLAAEQLFKYKRKVGFITSDTYRISAVEQLRTYASILGVPLEVAQSPGDLQRALQRLAECDLILMDTAGRNYRNELLVSELQSLLAPLEQSETYLVLALTSKTEDMRTITDHFSKYPLDKVIFTKADETGSYGALFNLLQDHPLRLSYMTNGQNVPDDLLMPSPDFLANLLLGEILP